MDTPFRDRGSVKVFGLFRRNSTPKDPISVALIESFGSLQEACKKTGAERLFRVVNVFSSLIIALRDTYPQFEIEEYSNAMSIVSLGIKLARPNDTEDIKSEILDELNYIAWQVGKCPRGDEYKLALMIYFIKPRYYENKMNSLKYKAT